MAAFLALPFAADTVAFAEGRRQREGRRRRRCRGSGGVAAVGGGAPAHRALRARDSGLELGARTRGCRSARGAGRGARWRRRWGRRVAARTGRPRGVVGVRMGDPCGRGLRGRDRGLRRRRDPRRRDRGGAQAGRPAPVGDTDHEIAVLRHCAGEGCVLLLRDDPGRGALLLERLGPSLYDLGLPVEERHEILGTTARQVWRPPEAWVCRRGRERRVGWRRGSSGPGRASAGRAARRRSSTPLTCAARRDRAYDPERALLVHGDVHQWNALGSGQASAGRPRRPDGRARIRPGHHHAGGPPRS